MGEITSEWPGLHQSGRDYIRVAEITSEWARLHQSGPDCIRVGQITSEWARLHQSGRDYIRMGQITLLVINVIHGTITYNTTTKPVSNKKLHSE